MTCYVDTVRHYPGAGLRFTDFCHLLADERAELHAMADAIGMPRRFFQDHPWRWHYDLPAHARAEALSLGAQEIELAGVGQLLKVRRAQFQRTAGSAASGSSSSASSPPPHYDDPADRVP